MPRSESVPIPAGSDLTQLTVDDATKMTIKNQGSGVVGLFGSASTTAPVPASGDLGLQMQVGQAIIGVNLADLFPGVTNVVRVFARSDYGGTNLFVSHD